MASDSQQQGRETEQPGRAAEQRGGAAEQRDGAAGRGGSTEELTPLVYQELRELARGYFKALRPGFTLRPTELVNEACLHLLKHSTGAWDSPEHFRAIATRKIWQVIVDRLRRRASAKRGGYAPAADGKSPDTPWQRIALDSLRIEWRDRQVELLDLSDALEDLAQQSPRVKEAVVLHWFGGMRYADVARILGVSVSTVEKDFRYALAWLNRRLSERGDGPG